MIDTLLPFAHHLADAAAAVIAPYFGAHGTVETKGDASPVTAADRAAEQAMRALIEAHYPTHGIYGEEFGTTHHSPLTIHYTWVLDPIDGTRNFIAGGTQWGTLIALCEGDTPILGILHQPITGERWVGVRGQQTQLFSVGGEGQPIHTRSCPTLAAAHISTTSRAYFTPPQAVAFAKLAEQCGQVIEGGDCVAYGLLARGQRDIVVDAGLKPYDILALVPIIEGAGGRITTWNGGPVTLSDYKDVLAVGDATISVPLRG